MRIYKDFKEAINEITRDVAEMGIKVHPQTMQNKQVADNPGYETLELQNYVYTVIDTDTSLLNPIQPWANAEFQERIGRKRVNPGEAWKLREEVWADLKSNGHMKDKFDYTYPERLMPLDFYGDAIDQIQAIIDEIKVHPDSRQLFLSIWDPTEDITVLGKDRVPCSLGYLFQMRKGKLNVTYIMRSCDLATHMQNDLYLTIRLRDYIAGLAGVETGTFTQFIGSLHVYKKDVKGVF